MRYQATYDPKTEMPMTLFNKIASIEGVTPLLHNVSNGVIEVEVNETKKTISVLEKIAKRIE